MIDWALQGRQRLYRLETAPLRPLDRWLAQFRHDRWASHLDAHETEVYRTRRERRGTTSTSATEPSHEESTA